MQRMENDEQHMQAICKLKVLLSGSSPFCIKVIGVIPNKMLQVKECCCLCVLNC